MRLTLPKAPKLTAAAAKAQLWESFKRQVAVLAKSVGVPEAGYELERVVTRDLRKSQAWKDFERAWTKLAVVFGFAEAERISRGDDLGVSDVDVALPLLPGALVDCKYQAHGWAHHTIFEKCEAKYLKQPGDYIIMPTKAGGKAGSLTTVRSEVFLDLLRRAHMLTDTKPGAMACVRCRGGSIFLSGRLSIGLCELVCDTCQVCVLLNESDIPHAVLAHGVANIIQFPLDHQTVRSIAT